MYKMGEIKIIPLAEYIVHEFNNKVEQVDRIKVMALTILNTLIATIISVQGTVSFLGIEGKLWPNVLVLIFAFSYFRMYRLWFVGHAMMGKFEQDEKTENNKRV